MLRASLKNVNKQLLYPILAEKWLFVIVFQRRLQTTTSEGLSADTQIKHGQMRKT